jgi:hypothetical protein
MSVIGKSTSTIYQNCSHSSVDPGVHPIVKGPIRMVRLASENGLNIWPRGERYYDSHFDVGSCGIVCIVGIGAIQTIQGPLFVGRVSWRTVHWTGSRK